LTDKRGLNTVLLLADLDGTITKSIVNNTYTFAKLFLKSRRDPRAIIMRALFAVLPTLSKLLILMRLNKVISLDAFLITALFFGIRREELKRFSYTWLFALLKSNLINVHTLAYINKLVERYERLALNVKKIMLTACTEEPACTIAKLLKFDYCIARQFHTLRHVIVSVKDHEDIPFFKYHKLTKYLEQLDLNVVNTLYIADIYSLKAEMPFISSVTFNYIVALAKDGNIISVIRLR